MNNPENNQSTWRGGLSDLSGVVLDDQHRKIYETASRGCRGTPMWRQRKLAEFQEYLALSMVSGRIRTMMADLTGPLRLMFELQAPVPLLPDPAGDLEVAGHALLGLTYPEEAIRAPQPGYSFVTQIRPYHLFLANAAPADPEFGLHGPGQAICLGSQIAANISVKEIILQTYGALTLQSVQLDEYDAAGVMNRAAAEWWLQNRDRIPLTREGFLELHRSNQS